MKWTWYNVFSLLSKDEYTGYPLSASSNGVSVSVLGASLVVLVEPIFIRGFQMSSIRSLHCYVLLFILLPTFLDRTKYNYCHFIYAKSEKKHECYVTIRPCRLFLVGRKYSLYFADCLTSTLLMLIICVPSCYTLKTLTEYLLVN